VRLPGLATGLLLFGTGPLGGQTAPPLDAELLVRTGGVWESNLDHELHPRPAYGGFAALGLEVRDDAARPTVSLDYEVALHRYTVPTRWDRTSQRGGVELALRLGGHWVWRLDGGLSLQGSSDDRDLGNEYRGATGLAAKPAPGLTIELGGALRFKRYPDDSSRNATNRYAEVELKQRVGGGVRLAMGGRLEANAARSARNSYRRATWAFGLRLRPGAADAIEAQLKLRQQRYPARRVEVNGRQVQRRDTRLNPVLAWTHRLRENLEVSLSYEFEARRSNDPDKGFEAHALSLVLTRRW
jgi:hypothetical protein